MSTVSESSSDPCAPGPASIPQAGRCRRASPPETPGCARCRTPASALRRLRPWRPAGGARASCRVQSGNSTPCRPRSSLAGTSATALALREREDRQVFPVGEERWIRAQIGGDFRGLTLLDGGPRGLQGVVVLQRQLDGLFQRDRDRRLLRERRIRQHQAAEHDGGRQRYSG